ncbi:MAG: hypothetical protein AB1758_19485 [Candidatus Eremiobacterota bacterium]
MVIQQTPAFRASARTPQAAAVRPQQLDSLSLGAQDPARVKGISTLVGAAIGGAAVGLGTAGLTGTAGAIVGAAGGAILAGSVGGFLAGSVAVAFTDESHDGWDRFAAFVKGFCIGGAICAVGGGVGGAYLGTGAANVLGVGLGAAAGGTGGYFVGKALAGR